MMSQSSALPFKWENLCACAVESCQHACTSISIPSLSSLTAMHELSHKFWNLISMPVTHIHTTLFIMSGHTCMFPKIDMYTHFHTFLQNFLYKM